MNKELIENVYSSRLTKINTTLFEYLKSTNLTYTQDKHITTLLCNISYCFFKQATLYKKSLPVNESSAIISQHITAMYWSPKHGNNFVILLKYLTEQNFFEGNVASLMQKALSEDPALKALEVPFTMFTEALITGLQSSQENATAIFVLIEYASQFFAEIYREKIPVYSIANEKPHAYLLADWCFKTEQQQRELFKSTQVLNFVRTMNTLFETMQSILENDRSEPHIARESDDQEKADEKQSE